MLDHTEETAPLAKAHREGGSVVDAVELIFAAPKW